MKARTDRDHAAMQAAEEALLRYARAKDRVDAYDGPLRGDFFAKRVTEWRNATSALDRASRALRRERIKSYLALRRARERGRA